MITIDLNNPAEFTVDNVARLLASVDDSRHRQLRVTKAGIAFMSDVVAGVDIQDLAFRFPTWYAGKLSRMFVSMKTCMICLFARR